MKCKFYKKWIFMLFLFSLLAPVTAIAGIDNYLISKRSDGGYTIAVRYSKRHWQPITAEGFFPVEKGISVIELKGKGEKREFKRTRGTYYGPENIGGRSKLWDFGYAWIDDNEKILHLKLFWALPPDDNVESNVNGKYDLTHFDPADDQLLKWLQTYREKESD